MSDVMIEARDLTKRYAEVIALQKASFEVRRGEVLGFLGPNGAGKTTTMKILTCFIAPTEGSAKVNGCDVFDDPIGARTALGYLPEANPLYKEMLVYEYLRWVGQIRGLGKEKLSSRLKTVVEETGLGTVIAKEIRALSKGFRQRVGLAQALIHEPPILILDEPMSGLDPNQTVEIRDLIKEIGRSRTVIFSTHNLAEVSVTCNRVLVIHQGRIVADDDPNALTTRFERPRFVVSVRESGDNGEGAATYRESADGEAFRKVKGVHDVKEIQGAPTGERHFEIFGTGSEDLRPELFRAAAAAGLTLVDLHRKPVNLETVFRELTKSTDAKPGKGKAKTKAQAEKDRARRKEEERRAREAAEEEEDDDEDLEDEEDEDLDDDESEVEDRDEADSDDDATRNSDDDDESDDDKDDDESDDDESDDDEEEEKH